MTRVLVVDDSSFMRTSLTHLLESDEAIHVIGTAADGAEALRKVKELRPDVVLLDLEMSGMNGLLALAHIMAEHPTPVLVLTGLSKTDTTVALRCLEKGALDCIPKPSGVISYDIGTLRTELIAKVKLAAEVNVRTLAPCCPRTTAQPLRHQAVKREQVVVIGASTGGPRAVAMILSALPPALAAAMLVVQHMSPAFLPSFVDRLRGHCALEIALACQHEALLPGRVLVAPGGCHTLIVATEAGKRIRLSDMASPHAIFPCIDFAMASAAEAYGAGAVGVLLTGIGSDGARGMKSIKVSGGRTIAEDSSTCLVFGMPRAAIELGCADQVVPLSRLASAIVQMI